MDESSLSIKQDVNSIEYRKGEIRRRAYRAFHSELASLYEELPAGNKGVEFIEKNKLNLIKFIPEAKKDIEEIDSSLDIYKTLSKEDLIEKVADITIEIIAKYFSLQELEERLQKRHTVEFGFQSLTRGLNFQIEEDNNTISLHIPNTFFENGRLALESIKNGLQILAEKVKSDPDLQKITEITGDSGLVKEKYMLIQRLGFEVIFDEEGHPTEHAEMSKEKLLELYGK